MSLFTKKSTTQLSKSIWMMHQQACGRIHFPRQHQWSNMTRFMNSTPCTTSFQVRSMAKRVTKDEISSKSFSQHEQQENELEIQRQLKYIHDYQQEIQESDQQLKSAIRKSTLSGLSEADVGSVHEQEEKQQQQQQQYYILNSDEYDEFGLDDIQFSDEVRRYIEMENEQHAIGAKKYSDAAMTAATNAITNPSSSSIAQEDEEVVIHSPVRGTMILDKKVRPPTLEDYVELLQRDLAQDMVVMNLRTKCTFASYCIFVTGTSFRHMRMMANHVLKMLKDRRMFHLRPCIEGEECEDWMLIDGGDIYVQIFSASGREYYDLERKWAFQKVEQFEPTVAGALKNQESVSGTTADAGGTYSFTLTTKPQPGEITAEDE